jgi:ribulose kinase
MTVDEGTEVTLRALLLSGGSGTDTVVASNLTGVTFSNVEILQTQNAIVTGTAAQFGSFATIRVLPTIPTAQVQLIFAAGEFLPYCNHFRSNLP